MNNTTYLIKSRSDRHLYTHATWDVFNWNEMIARFKIKCAPGYCIKSGSIVPLIPTSEELQTRTKEDIIVFILSKTESDCELMERCLKGTLINYCAFMHECLTGGKGISPFQKWLRYMAL